MARQYTAGDLDQLVTVQQRATVSGATQNALGENTSPWVDLATVWAKASPIRGREFFAQGQQQQTIDVMFVLRYRADITASMRVSWNGVPYAIAAPPIHVDARKEWLELMTVQGAHDGV
jgi:SPP1 family predicted phage head-tail adaptor